MHRNMKNLQNTWKRFVEKESLTPVRIFAILAVGVILANALEWPQDLEKIFRKKSPALLRFSGMKFLGINRFLPHASYVGYFTDRDLKKDTKASAQFAQAQYVLAPNIIEANNLSHEFILFDCTSEDVALEKIRDIGAIPLKKNKFGIILATTKKHR